MMRGFRFQTGEISDVADEITANGCCEMDVDDLKEIDDVFIDLGEYNINFTGNIDENAVDRVKVPEFHGRYFVTYNDDQEGYIDFHLIEEEEESYDEIFWG